MDKLDTFTNEAPNIYENTFINIHNKCSGKALPWKTKKLESLKS